ncbi:MAG: glycosyltransferase [Bacteroidales bacterium]|nr:glycosyltransferase [Bacteroidales bacterium]
MVLLSENFKNQLLQKYPALAKEKMVIYSNVPDVEALQSYPADKDILPEKGDSKVLFYFGGIAQRRGIYTLIEAHQQLLQQGYDVKLLLIGPADKAERESFLSAISKGVNNQTIIYHEWKAMTYLPSYIMASDICFSPIVKNPQHESGIANKVFQYMLFERPVVVSDSKPQKDLVEEGGCGLAFRSEDVEDLATKTAWLLNHPKEARQMGARGKQQVINTYNSKAMARNLATMYQKMGEDD